MIKPKGSIRARELGRRAAATDRPGHGRHRAAESEARLKTISKTLNHMPAAHADDQPSRRRHAVATCRHRTPASRTSAQNVAITRFAPGPAAATRIMSRLGLRRFRNTTGTGFAQPNVNAPFVSSARPIGTITVPSGIDVPESDSTESRPSLYAVGSPSCFAAQPCATSCSVIAKTTGIAPYARR